MSSKARRLFARLAEMAGKPSCCVTPEESPPLPHTHLGDPVVPNPSRIWLHFVSHNPFLEHLQLPRSLPFLTAFVFCSFFSVPFSTTAPKGFSSSLLSLVVLPQICLEGQGKRGQGIPLFVGLSCPSGKAQEVFWTAEVPAGPSTHSHEVAKHKFSPEEEDPPS